MRTFNLQKITSLILAGAIAFGACACSNAGKDSSNGRLKVVTTIFPEYDWVRNIAGDNIDNIELTLLCDNGVDMHSFQPTASDIVKISSCDVFVYVGGESDEWVSDVFKEAVNKNMQVVNLMAVLDGQTLEEEIVEGMQTEEEDEGGKEYDEHVWLSLNHAQRLVIEIAKAMAKADPDNEQKYLDNAEEYGVKLYELDLKYQEAVSSGSKDTILFGDRFPFRYLTDDYGIKYYAAFAGCSAETEASFETVVFLANKVNELGLDSVITIDGGAQSIAKTIIDNTSSKDQEILVMDSMQSTKSSDNSTYVGIMENNLEVLKKALR